ncbi:MAG TPA: arsenate reductase ArsC [Candidatus Limnocylindrales bacterium]|nr:arsenate reductase ArsC [Candidatus Limnocylindrales bacterium]
MSPPIRVLVICWGNSARSILAEALLRHHGGGDFDVDSAGIEPKGVNPFTLRVLDEAGLDHAWARSKSAAEFLDESFDYVITVCDDARTVCPVFAGETQTVLHWGYDDPAQVEGTDKQRLAAFERTLTLMDARIDQFVELARRERREREALGTADA